ncbi:hypothetical protein COOONC_11280 [Cooperia oncophora]
MVSSTELSPKDKAKKLAAFECAEKNISSGCRLGVGSGSTVKYLVEYLENAVKSGKLQNITCVPTSYQASFPIKFVMLMFFFSMRTYEDL